jgi:tetratricopeptide (TPR) repeat protein
MRQLVVFCWLIWTPAMAGALGWTGSDLGGIVCDGAGQGFGPWDYYEVDEPTDPMYYDGRWWEAAKVHAAPGFQALNDDPFDQGAYNRAASEFDYLLRAYPNHPQILQGVIQLELKRLDSGRRLIKFETPPECYLQRAQMFRPTQAHIPQLMGIYLQKLGKIEQAIDAYKSALHLNPQAAEIQYNLGLALFDAGDHRLAAACARDAYSLGYPLRGLQNKLERADFDFGDLPEELSCNFEDGSTEGLPSSRLVPD